MTINSARLPRAGLMVAIALAGCSQNQPVRPQTPVATKAETRRDSAGRAASDASRPVPGKDLLAEFERGKQALVQKEFDLAIAAFDKYLREIPDDESAFFNRGLAYRGRNEIDKAIASYSEAIRLNPQLVQAVHNRGDAYLILKQYDKALVDATEAVRLDPKQALHFINRGAAHRGLRQFEAAVQDFTAAIRLDGKYVSAYYNRGMAFVDLRETEEAIDDFSEAISLQPKVAKNWLGRAMAFRTSYELKTHDLHDLEAAIQDYTEAISLEPTNADNFRYRGDCYKQRDDYRLAVADYSTALELDPQHMAASFNLAWLLATCAQDDIRDGQRAVKLATSARGRSEWRPEFQLETLAAAYAETGNFADATKWVKQALELKPDSQKLMTQLKLYETRKPYRQPPNLSP